MADNDTKGRRSTKKGGERKKNEQERTVVKKGRGGSRGNRSRNDAKHQTSNEKISSQNQRRGSSKRGKVGRRNSKGIAKGRNKNEKKEPLTAEQLDASMDDYWQQSKDKTIVSKKLDDDMDDYWAKKEEGKTEIESTVENGDSEGENKQE